MDSFMKHINFLLDWFQNISILVLLILLYNYIPDRFFIHRDRRYAVCVGLIFTFAAVISIAIPWSGTQHPSVGINGILVPLAGWIGGPISGAIITSILLILQVQPITTGKGIADGMIIISGCFIGILFYLVRERRIIGLDNFKEILIFSSVNALLTIPIMMLFHPGTNPVGKLPPIPAPSFLEVAGIIFIGLFLLGTIIRSIDQKRDNEYELFCYKEHLEALVQERTAELEQINSFQKATIESTTDGIIVTNREGRIQEWNGAAAELFHISTTPTLEKEIHILRPIQESIDPDEPIPELFCNLQSIPDHPIMLCLRLKSERVLDVSVFPQRLEGKTIGWVFNFRDITERKRAEEKLKNTTQKLLLLSGITRHDILNQITALYLYLHLVQQEIIDTGIRDYLEKMNQSLKVMQMHIEFTSDYQDVGLHEPLWQNPFEAFKNASSAFQNEGITFISNDIPIWIFSDPLLERVFYNCIDNSLRHGEKVTTITLDGY